MAATSSIGKRNRFSDRNFEKLGLELCISSKTLLQISHSKTFDVSSSIYFGTEQIMTSIENTELERLDEVKVADAENSGEEIKPDDVYQKIQEYKEIIATVRGKPWPMHEKIRILK